jgi:pantoate--beta-alanine ligase
MPPTATSLRRVSRIAEVRAAVARAREEGRRIGFVPTMGALHQGHLSLVNRARGQCDFVVMSIFVNPLQFGPHEDFTRYPRPIEDDERLASAAGVDLLFTPTDDEMYPGNRAVGVSSGKIGTLWEGAIREAHFNGVLTVVAKLFNIVQPDVAVFGRKDLQQATLVRLMVRDLDFPLKIDIAPTVREEDGLALSSRNRYLTRDERQEALSLSKALRATCDAFDAGERDVSKLERTGNVLIPRGSHVTVDYFGIVDPDSFEREDVARQGSAVIVAAHVGSTRLIDNMILGQNDQN